MAERGTKWERAAAAEVWRRLFDFFLSTRPQRDRVLQRLGLTPNDARALGSLGGSGEKTMRALAEEWECDASNATWMIDRLEKRGLARRRVAPHDRRVKWVVLTAQGVRTKRQLLEGMYEPPTELSSLTSAELETFRALLDRLLAADSARPAQ
jgi:DNA-binding MarR family transcriptional regulator